MEKFSYTCMRCGGSWQTTSDSPVKCKLCGTTSWDKPVANKHRISPTVEPKAFQGGALCTNRDCNRKAVKLHPVLGVPVCGHHGRHHDPSRAKTNVSQPGPEFRNPRMGSVDAVRGRARATPVWSNIRYSSKGLNGPVELKNAVNKCIACEAPIARAFKWCKECFNKLPDEEKTAWYRERRKFKYRPQPNLQAASSEQALRLESAQKLASNRSVTCPNSSN